MHYFNLPQAANKKLSLSQDNYFIYNGAALT